MNIPAKIILRDLLVLSVCVGLWAWVRQLEAASSSLTVAVSILTGLATAFTGFLAHEWGHLTGAWLGRSTYEPAGSVRSLFLFKFNSDLNTREQFLLMSNGGFLVSILAVAFLFGVLSFHHLADGIALVLTALGVVATFILEVPAAWKVYKGAGIPRGAAYSSK